MTDIRPIRTISPDSPLVDVECGDLTPVDGHRDHMVTYRELRMDVDVWLTVRCQCGETFGGAFSRERLRIVG